MSELTEHPILIGNSFPLALVRRRVVIEPLAVEDLREVARSRGVVSFWGHANTLSAASQVLGCDLTPEVERPALTLAGEGFPSLAGVSYAECYVLSANYREHFRPSIGMEVPLEQIASWQALRLTWK